MVNDVLRIDRLEHVLQLNWADFLDYSRLMRHVLEYSRDTPFKTIRQEEIPPRQVKLTITRFKVVQAEKDSPCAGTAFEAWVEFTAPKGNGVVIGTGVYLLSLSGEMHLKEGYGTHFVPEIP